MLIVKIKMDKAFKENAEMSMNYQKGQNDKKETDIFKWYNCNLN